MSSAVHVIRAKQEDISQFKRSMARLNQLMKQWRVVNQQSEQLDQQRVDLIESHFQKLTEIGDNIINFTASTFANLTQRIPELTEIVQQDIQQQQQIRVENATRERLFQSNRKENAQILLDMMQQSLPEHQTLIEQLSALTQDNSDNRGSQALSKAMQLIGQRTAELTAEQSQLLEKLKQPTHDISNGLTSSVHASEQRLLRIERHIAELMIFDPQQDRQLWNQRAADLRLLARNSHWNTSSDSLILDLAAATHLAKWRFEKRQLISSLAAELLSFENNENSDLLAQAEQVLTEPSAINALIAQLEAAIEQQQQQVAAMARREAVLDGLAKLGYEVQEQMASAWLHEGKVVIRKPATPGYGIELGGAKESERFQIRTVAFSEQRDQRRDADIDAILCSEHQKLSQLLADAGDELTLVRALDAGASVLKVVTSAKYYSQQHGVHSTQKSNARKI